jgi:hypothetical protein
MTDAPEDLVVKSVFLALIERGGGADAHDAAQIEIAAAAARIMVELRSSDPDDGRKLSSTLGTLLPMLPEPERKSGLPPAPRIDEATTAAEAAAIYRHLVEHGDEYDWGEPVHRSRELSDADRDAVTEFLRRTRASGATVTPEFVKSVVQRVRLFGIEELDALSISHPDELEEMGAVVPREERQPPPPPPPVLGDEPQIIPPPPRRAPSVAAPEPLQPFARGGLMFYPVAESERSSPRFSTGRTPRAFFGARSEP